MLIPIYQFLREHYRERSKWKFIHYLVYDATMVLAILSAVLSGVGILASFICFLIQSDLMYSMIKATIGCGVMALLTWSAMNWIEHE